MGMAHGLMTGWMICGLIGAASVALGEPADEFQKLFGKDLERVASTNDTNDDGRLAVQIFEVSKTITEPKLKALMLRNVFTLGSKDAGGYRVGADAMAQIADLEPEGRIDNLRRAILLYQKNLTASKGADAKAEAGDLLINALLHLAELQKQTGPATAAAETYKRALGVVGTTNRTDEIRAAMNAAVDQQKAGSKIQQLRDRIKADPKDVNAVAELIKQCLVVLDDPAEAMKYTFLSPDKALQDNVRLAAGDPATLTEPQMMALGDWYRAMVSDAPTADGRTAMLKRARGYYGKYLASHGDKDAEGTKARLVAAEMDATLSKSAPGARPDGSPSPQAGGQWLDALAAYNPAVDRSNGNWTRKGAALVQGEIGWDNYISLPVTIGGDYEFTTEFLRTQGGGQLILRLPIPGTDRHIDASFGAPGHGLQLTNMNNSVSYNPEPFARSEADRRPGIGLNEAYTAHVRVASKGSAAEVAVEMNNREVLHWRGETGDIYGGDDGRGNTLRFVTRQAGVEIRSFKIKAIKGGVELKHGPAGEAPANGNKGGNAGNNGNGNVNVRVGDNGNGNANIIVRGGDNATGGRYLSDMPEQVLFVFRGANVTYFWKKGSQNDCGPVVINGIASPNGLLTHPDKSNPARVAYNLGGKFTRFTGAVGVNDSGLSIQSQLTFAIVGDDRVLWTSRPTKTVKKVQPFDVDVANVQRLELVTLCHGVPDAAHAVWVEPKLAVSPGADTTNLSAPEGSPPLVAALLNPQPSAPSKPKPDTHPAASDPAAGKPSASGKSFFGIPID